MSPNFFLSFILIIFATVTVLRTQDFISSNKIENPVPIWLYSVLLAVLCLSYVLELSNTDLEWMKAYQSAKSIAIFFTPGLAYIVTLVMADKLYKVKTYHYILIFIIPLAGAVLRLTAQYHDLIYYDFSVANDGAFTYLSYSRGIWFYIFSLYAAGLLSITIASIVKRFINIRNKKFPLYLVLILMVVASVLLILILSGISLLHVSFFPFVLPLFTIVVSTNYIRYKFFGTIPYAHQKAFERSISPVLILSDKLNLLDFNVAALKAIPLLSKKMINANISDFLDYDGRVKISVVTDKECRIRIVSDYSVKQYKVTSSALFDNFNNKNGYLVVLTDITEFMDTMSELTELASVDTLTCSHTRRYFINSTAVEFDRAKRHSHPLSFIILDLDYFKNINDEFGHMAGDAMLKSIADICKSKIRSIDLLGRFGGEEFMILLPETDIDGAVYVAERIRQTIEETEFIYENHIMNMTVSLGVTGVDKIDGEDFDTLLKYADRALYVAKETGRNKVEYMHCGQKEQVTEL